VLGIWLLSALLWTREAAVMPVVFSVGGAAGVLLLWGWAGLKGRKVTRLVPGFALGVALSGPANWLQSSGSPKMPSLLGSLFLFGAGYAVAVSRTARRQ
jgi:hypothetical protein